MDSRDYKMVDLSDRVSIPVPKDLSAEDEAQYIAEYKAKYMARAGQEYEELEDMLQGRTPRYSFEDFLKTLERERDTLLHSP